MVSKRLIISGTESEIHEKRETDNSIDIVVGAIQQRQRGVVRQNTWLRRSGCRLRPIGQYDRAFFIRIICQSRSPPSPNDEAQHPAHAGTMLKHN
jgi:hypothetical protein